MSQWKKYSPWQAFAGAILPSHLIDWQYDNVVNKKQGGGGRLIRFAD